MKEVNAPNCGRENELIAFLYGELNENDSAIFRRHVYECAPCSAELASLEEVRESVVSWRNESLGAAVSPVRIADSSPMEAIPERISAWAALRQFFKLSPLWLKGAVAMASVMLCLLAGLAVARLREKPPAAVVANRGNTYSQEEINALVEQRVQGELQRIKTSQEKSTSVAVLVDSKRPSSRGVAGRVQEVALSGKARRPLSKTERQQLAADLRLTTAKNESELDLLDDGINQ
jgi:anti-sigma factor RsiW